LSEVTSQDRSSLFRGEAFEYHFREQESRGVLNTSMRHPWSIVLASILLLCAALTYTLVAEVEVVYRAEGAMKLQAAGGDPRSERLAIVYVHGRPYLSVKPGARVRLELLRPMSGGSQFIDGRLTALARAPTRLEIALDQPAGDQVSTGGGNPIPVRIHAVGCLQSLWRLPLNASSACPER
jgi:hypothetical protein